MTKLSSYEANKKFSGCVTTGSRFKNIKIACSHLLHITNIPFSVIHFVTNRCNLKCRHCFIYGNFESDTHDPRYTDRELNLSQIDKLTKSMKGQLVTASLTGGEPMLRPDLLEIAKLYVDNAGANVVEVSTNGTTQNAIERFVKGFMELTKAQLYLSLSFDGLRNRHDRNRGLQGSFEKAVDTARFLGSLKLPRLQVSATIAVLDQPIEELTELFYFLVNDVKVDSVATAALRGKPAESGNIKFNLGCYRKLNKLVRDHILSRSLSPFKKFQSNDLIKACTIVSRQKIEQTLAENRYIAPCTGGRASVIIHSDGSVYPCEVLNEKMGDLDKFNMNIVSLMKSKHSEQIQKLIHTSKCFCSFECAWTYNIIFEPQNWKDLFFQYIRLKLKAMR